MENITFECAECHKPLGKNRYTRSPRTNLKIKNKAWCPDCFESISRLSRRDKTLNDMELMTDNSE